MPLLSVEPQRLYRQIAEQVRLLIGSGEFAAHERLPAERDLARQLGVSRPTVREALIALEVEGWVEVRCGSGVYAMARPAPVCAPLAAQTAAEWGPLELIRARRVVEGETAALAAALAKRRDLAAIRQAIESMEQDAQDKVPPLAGDRAFHGAIVQASGNSVLIETVHAFWDSRRGPVFERLGGHFESAPSWRAAIAEHRLILEAIEARDAGAARTAMHSHMDRAHARFSASWRRTKKNES
jgi:DNA-binding FadR family transcriptional regulator